jgi:hypothetical protein
MPHLDEGQAVQIFKFKLDSPQLSSAALATIYCVSEKTVRDIWTGRTWSKTTQHLDMSRPLQQPGHPMRCEETRQKKKRASGMRQGESSSHILTGSSSSSAAARFSEPSSVGLSGPHHIKTRLTEQVLGPHQSESDNGCWLKSTRSKLSMQGFETVCADQYIEACSSSWHQSDPSLWYNTVVRNPSSVQLHASMDDQLHDWGAFWRSCPNADPFRSDWTPKPLEYHDA